MCVLRVKKYCGVRKMIKNTSNTRLNRNEFPLLYIYFDTQKYPLSRSLRYTHFLPGTLILVIRPNVI